MILSNILGSLVRRPWQISRARRARGLLASGISCEQSGDLDGARRNLERAIALDGDCTEAHHRLGILDAKRGAFASALRHLERAQTLSPESGETCIDLGNVYRLLQDPVRAEARYRDAIHLSPAASAAHLNLARVLAETGRKPLALEHFRQAHLLAPHDGPTLRSFVLALIDSRDYVQAENILGAAMRRTERTYDALYCSGFLRQKQHDAPQAAELYQAALALRDDDPELHNNLGITLQDLGRVDEALTSYDRALQLRPDFPLAAFHRALARLLAGDFGRGWDDYEWRLRSEDRPDRPHPYRQWDGSSLHGRTILAHGEQGLGDEIMFASCIPEIIAAAGHCVIECSPKLQSLFARSFPEATVYAATPGYHIPEAVTRLGIHCETAAGSLPRLLRRERAAFPRHTGYLKADPLRVSRWRKRLAEIGPGPHIGISWRGGTFQSRAPLRTLELPHWLPIFRAIPANFVSLQYSADAVEDVAGLREQQGVCVHHWQDAIDDYEETAALTCAVDLVVSVCTALIHLGGALGRPVWVLAPYSPEWRYGIAGESMPWYPSVRVLRQPAYGQWHPVVAKVAAELECFKAPSR